MLDPVAKLRRTAMQAAREELIAQRSIQETMAIVLGGQIDASVFRARAGGIEYAAWTNLARTKGLIVRQTMRGQCVAIDIESGKGIATGDGLSGVVEDVIRYYRKQSPKR